MGGLAGALGGMVMQAAAGVIKEVTHSYLIMFVIAGSVYVLAVIVVHLLAPRLKRVEEQELENKPMPLAVTGVLGAVAGFVAGVPLSFLFQNGKGLAGNFGMYTSSIITGDIFKPENHRADYVNSLIGTPLIAAAALAVLGVMLHKVLFQPKHAL